MPIPLAACTVDVRHGDGEADSEVDVRSPVGEVSVRTEVDVRDTGLAVYPGARRLREERDPKSATVTVANSWFGVKVVAATFESTDTPEKVVDFYRTELRTYGDVVVCRGDLDVRRNRFSCRENAASRDVQLGTGTEARHRIVAVKPRGEGTEFGLVFVETSG